MSMTTLRIVYLTLLFLSVAIELALLDGEMIADKRTRSQMSKLSWGLWTAGGVLMIIHVIHRAAEQ